MRHEMKYKLTDMVCYDQYPSGIEKLTVAEAIERQKQSIIQRFNGSKSYEAEGLSDEEALLDFMAIHWAWFQVLD